MRRNSMLSRAVIGGGTLLTAVLVVRFLGWGALLLMGFVIATVYGGGVGTDHT